jgi:acyl dehydratase
MSRTWAAPSCNVTLILILMDRTTVPEFSRIEPGHRLPELVLPPVSRTTLALYAGASGDHNPNHIDIDFARAAGMDDVFAHGMLAMAYLGRLLGGWMAPGQVREFSARFTSITHVGDSLTCSGVVTEKTGAGACRLVTVQLQAMDQHGDIKITGSAVIGF